VLAIIGVLNFATIMALIWWGSVGRTRAIRADGQWRRAWAALTAERDGLLADRDALKKQWLAAVRELRGDERAATQLWVGRKPTIIHYGPPQRG
jgi:hypothetical protein